MKSMKRLSAVLICLITSILMLCGSVWAQESRQDMGSPIESGAIDYSVLVNKTHPLPDEWEDALETVHFTNSVGDNVEVEKKAYESYLQLKEDLEQEGVSVDLDSAYRSVAAQQKIMDDFTKQYGADFRR